LPYETDSAREQAIHILTPTNLKISNCGYLVKGKWLNVNISQILHNKNVDVMNKILKIGENINE
jgi:hypothetical protein